MEITGILHAKFDTVQVTASFSKRDFVLKLEENPQYPQFVTFQLTQEKCSMLDSFPVGNRVKVAFNLRGKEYKTPQGEIKYFNTLDAWSVMPLGVKTNEPFKANENFKTELSTDANGKPYSVENSDNNDDLPF